MSDEISIDGEQYISSKRASEITKYTQDYVGQLARGGQVRARRVGGLWYIAQASIEEHKTKADAYKPVPPGYHQNIEQESLLSFDGKAYVSAPYASKLTGYSPDYVGQLARAGTVQSRQVGNRWYVDRQAIVAHKDTKDGLLGAVQAESVGIKRVDTGDKEFSYATPGPLLKYTTDERDLMPTLKDVRQEDKKSVENAIPIHVFHPKRSRIVHVPLSAHASQAYRLAPVRASGITRKHIVIPAVAITIVIILSIGFISLKDYSQYAAKSQIVESSGQAAAAGVADTLMAYAATVGDFLEVYLATEIVYRRSSQEWKQ